MKSAFKRPREDDETPTPATKKPRDCEQPTLAELPGSSLCTVTQARVDQLVTNYIVNCMRPLSTVEAEPFVELVTGLQPKKTVMTRKTLDGQFDSLSHLHCAFKCLI